MRNLLTVVLVAVFVLAVGAVVLAAWFLAMPGASHRGEPPPLSREGDALRERLRGHVARLATGIGERNGQSYANLTAARDYAAEQLRLAGYEPVLLAFRHRGETFHNVEAVLAPRAGSDESVVIGAHYDSVEGSPGADDNASGVAVVLEIARVLRDRPLRLHVRFVAFANEETPYFNTADGMGSVAYARAFEDPEREIRAMLSIETVGFYRDDPGSQHYPPPLAWLYPDRGNFVAFIGNLGSRSLVKRAVGAFRRAATLPSEGAALPAEIPGVAWSDHRSFWEIGVPAIMVTDTAFYRYAHYHLPSDTPEQLDYERMARLVAGLAEVVTSLADTEP